MSFKKPVKSRKTIGCMMLNATIWDDTLLHRIMHTWDIMVPKMTEEALERDLIISNI